MGSTQWGKTKKIFCHAKFFLSNQFRVKFLCKKGDLTEILRQNHGSSKIPYFPQCVRLDFKQKRNWFHGIFADANFLSLV